MFNRKQKTTIKTETLSQEGRDWLGFFRVAKRLGQGKLLNPETMSAFTGLCGVSQDDQKAIKNMIDEEKRRATPEAEMQEATMGALLNSFAGMKN